MLKFQNLLPALFCALLITACAKETPASEPAPDPATERIISGGKIIGITTADSAYSWRGLPFAAPPVGDLRWRAPRKAASWEGMRDATEFAPRCMQLSNRLDAGEGVEPGVLLGSEDCLYLDVYAPPGAEGKDLPVMMWIHGGANVWGRASSYDGSRLALNENVVIVAVQYRLGPFGFFSHEALRDAADAPEDRAANFATLDLIASLKWVRENISAFGGDPANVTIFGESAGGHNVATLLASPLAAGLFDHAIIESGSFASASKELAETGHKNSSNAVTARLGVTNAEELRAVSAKELIDAYEPGELAFLEMPTVIEDGVVLPDGPMRDAFSSTETFNAIPVITGTNRDEMKFFNFARPDLTKKKFFIFLVPRDRDYYQALNEYMSRIWRIQSVDEPAEAMIGAGHGAVYAYRFDWDDSGKFFFTDLSTLIGAAHAVEIPFVFNRFELFGPKMDKIFFHKRTAAAREELSRAMGAYWAEFARTGNPGRGEGDLARWSAWGAESEPVLRRLDTDGGGDYLHGADSISALAADLKDDARLDDEKRCKIVNEIRLWDSDISQSISRQIGCDVAAR